jgi:hypothetical protein
MEYERSFHQAECTKEATCEGQIIEKQFFFTNRHEHRCDSVIEDVCQNIVNHVAETFASKRINPKCEEAEAGQANSRENKPPEVVLGRSLEPDRE